MTKHNTTTGSLLFSNSYAGLPAHLKVNLVINASMQALWPVEGDYKPLVELFMLDGSSQNILVDSVVLHVYPQEQLAQIETNEVSLATNEASFNLSIVVFLFSIFTVIALIFQILDRPETNRKCPKDGSDKNQNRPAIEEKTNPANTNMRPNTNKKVKMR
jgi:hypothetical protein